MVRLLDVLLAIFLTATPIALAWGEREDELQRLPRWDFWPPLPSRPHFTGIYLSSRPGQNHLKPQTFEAIDLFNLNTGDAATKNVLYYGSVLLYPTVLEGDAASSNVAVQRAYAFARQSIKASAQVNLSPTAELDRAVLLPLSITGDNGESEMVVVHQYTTTKRETRRYKSHVSLGINFYLTIRDTKFNMLHRVVVALDREGAHNLFQHTYASLSDSGIASNACVVGGAGCAVASQAAANPRILSYNVWNTNPSNDVYGASRRWGQYIKRMDHLVKFVEEARADIIGFQEVRYDGVFGKRGEHTQVQHLAQRLPGYQFVYQAAMSYTNERLPYERIEEGPAIFSKFPIVHTDYLLLSRSPNDPNDSHQRLCLHAVVDHPSWGWIDVYVTHLSLGERSREKTMVEIWEYMKQGKGVTQVLLGDLNAEPQSRGIKFLRGEAELEGVKTDLRDAWLDKHNEAEPRSTDPIDRQKRFTFPCDDPVKRIDFVLYRGKGSVKECEILGQDPTQDTKDLRKDVGMLHPRSPVYASDHRGVVAEFV